MTTYLILVKRFERFMNEYIEHNGNPQFAQIKQLAKQFAIDSRNGIYDITARKRYVCIFRTYCFRKSDTIELPDDFYLIEESMYDPDNEFPNDPAVIRGKRREEKKIREGMQEIQEYIRNREIQTLNT